jgi:LCP family protein required for cell wall assembly
MLPGHETPPRAGRSGFVAAFLSLLFPGLGHAYLGAYRRGLGFAAPPILLGALIAGIAVRMSVIDLAGVAVQTWFLTGLFIVNLVALAYRAAAIIDAWAIARALGRGATTTAPRQAQAAATLSIAGLAAVLLVMSAVHVAVARYDLLLTNTTACVFGGSGAGCGNATGSPGPGDSPEASEPADSGAPIATNQLPPWNGKGRLNILLIGADEQDGGHNTDTMIVVSIDPDTDQVAMFSLPRDTVDVPIPPGPARNVFGATYQGKINSWWAAVHNHPSWFPPITVDGQNLPDGPGYSGLKAILGNLYQLNIQYFVEVNFKGFESIVDAFGGVTVNVEVPVIDDYFPLAFDHRDRLYIPAGPQHMTGKEALQYARSRHQSSDFDRGARQQRLLVALRRQTNIGAILPHLDELAQAVEQSFRTDIPRELVPQLLGLAEKVNTNALRSVIFTPPFYGTEDSASARGYVILPRVDRIRAAVKEAFTVDPAFADARDAIASEGATLWVLNGSGKPGEAASLAAYLNYYGIAATAPTQKPDTTGLSATTIRVYNGAADRDPLTIQALQQFFGVTPVLINDPAIRVDIVIITAKSTPLLTPPPVP